MWIELHQELRLHPKIIRLAKALNVKRSMAMGYVINLWLWAVSYASDGDLSEFSDKEIAEACDSELDPKILFDSLKKDFVDEKKGKFILHDWKKHGLRVLEQSKKRTRKYRREKELKENAVTSQLRDRHVLLSILSNLSIPSNHVLYGEEFQSTWDSWEKFRREKKKPLTKTTIEAQIKWLYKQLDPIACINESIRNGWQGLFEMKNDASNARKPDPPMTRKANRCIDCKKEIPESEGVLCKGCTEKRRREDEHRTKEFEELRNKKPEEIQQIITQDLH